LLFDDDPPPPPQADKAKAKTRATKELKEGLGDEGWGDIGICSPFRQGLIKGAIEEGQTLAILGE